MTCTDNRDGDNFPCKCHLPEYAYTDGLCPECGLNLAAGNANPDEERELLDTPGDEGAWDTDADNDSFGDACSRMSREDWDADNDWLASAGWGEM